MFDNWDSKDTAMTIQGVGSLASAWGDYETNKKKNKLLQERLNYEKQKDTLANEKMALAQSNFDDAFANVDILAKKKKKKDPLLNEATDTQMA